jgi:hypothetical protein
MNATTGNIVHGTGNTSATHRPRSLEELFDREEKLAKAGMLQQAELIGGDALDALNVPLHFRRTPLGTSAVLAGAGMFLATRFGRRGRRRGASAGLSGLLRNFVGSTLAGALMNHVGQLSGFGRRTN